MTQVGYPATNLAEDAMLLQRVLHAGRRLARVVDPWLFVRCATGRNAWGFESGGSSIPRRWHRITAPAGFTFHILERYRAAERATEEAAP